MNSAERIYEQIMTLNQAEGYKGSSQERLLRYCSEVLGAVERLHVDFKEKHDRRNGQLEDDDKKNLAKAVSGFANSSGGILVWGIKDKTMSPKPVTQIEEFVQSMLELAPHLTDPIVQGIDGNWIAAEDQRGFGIIFIPESFLPPHRVVLNHGQVKNHYYVRSGSSFIIPTHTQLEDMFGRRPKPSLSLSIRTVFYSQQGQNRLVNVIVGIENKGRGTAKSPFLAVNIHSPYEINRYGIDGNGGFGLEKIASASDSKETKYGASANVVIHPGVVHDIVLIRVPVNVMRPREFTPDLVIDYRIAAEGILPIEGQKVVRGFEFWAVLE
ncbi:MAG: ATP-binding protein [Anaerolineales bacterium]|nr:ATP-binding protein [Anaerolineales bacterium]